MGKRLANEAGGRTGDITEFIAVPRCLSCACLAALSFAQLGKERWTRKSSLRMLWSEMVPSPQELDRLEQTRRPNYHFRSSNITPLTTMLSTKWDWAPHCQWKGKEKRRKLYPHSRRILRVRSSLMAIHANNWNYASTAHTLQTFLLPVL